MLHGTVSRTTVPCNTVDEYTVSVPLYCIAFEDSCSCKNAMLRSSMAYSVVVPCIILEMLIISCFREQCGGLHWGTGFPVRGEERDCS